MAEVDAYIETLPKEQRWDAQDRLSRIRYCPHWRPICHGRVRCTATGLVDVLWNRRSEHFAAIFYRKHTKARERDKGCMIGDAVKDCDCNRSGLCFTFPSDPRNKGVPLGHMPPRAEAAEAPDAGSRESDH